MIDAPGPVADAARHFPSLAVMRSAHRDLLKHHRRSGDTPELLGALQDFLRRGGATGALLETDSERQAGQGVLDYWASILYRAGVEPPDASLVEFDPGFAPELDDDLCPYPGTDAYQEEDRASFCGRQRLLEECLDRLVEHRLVAVVGPPGSGKTSLVQAALLPALKSGRLKGIRDRRHLPPITPGTDPLMSLVRLFQPRDAPSSEWAEHQIEGFRRDVGHLKRLIAESDGGPALIVIDRLEELFTLCEDDPSRRVFLDNLIELIQVPGGEHALILTMRSDSASRVARMTKWQSLFKPAQVLVAPPTAGELREMIVTPAELVGLKLEEGLIDSLLNDLLGEPAPLLLLQFTLLGLWENRARNRITWEAYRHLEGGRRALVRGAGAFYEGLAPAEQAWAKRLLLRMIRLDEGMEITCDRVRRTSLCRPGDSDDQIDRILDKLVGARLVRRTGGDSHDDAQVELTHEVLVHNWSRMAAWLEEERETIGPRLWLLATAEQWREMGRDPGALWGGVLLDEALCCQDLNDLETEFVQASRRAEDARARCIQAVQTVQAAEARILEAYARATETTPNSPDAKTGNRPTLMVVDDEPEVLESVYNLFRLDYTVLKFERGGDALRVLEQCEPDVILSDQRMPEMLGVEFLHRVKQLRPDTTRLLFSGYADMKAVINAINQGNVFRYITKPWDAEELTEIVRHAVDFHDLNIARRMLLEELQKAHPGHFEAMHPRGPCIDGLGGELDADLRRP